MRTITVLFLGLGAMWVLQFGMTWWQAKAFQREVGQLRRHGRVAVGMGRRRPLRRAYVALAVGTDNRVVAARALSGLTVFARPRPLPALAGVTVTALARGRADPALPPLLRTAAEQAAGFLVRHRTTTATVVHGRPLPGGGT